ncbi:MAG: hypothetical protein OXH86_08850 [Acidimicrobiaceae bacterium]|nr:hypothetical protein [Acidimicrobiaceae bacterium]
MKRHARCGAVAAALALAGSILVAVPAGAENSVGSGSEVFLGEPWDRQPSIGEEAEPGEDSSEPSPNDQGTGLEEDSSESLPQDEGTGPDSVELPRYNDAIGDLQPEGSVGPGDFAEVPRYGAVWAPGEAIPSAVTILNDNDNVDLFTFEPEDRSLFAALLVIDNHEAPAEYRFENAVPEGRTAELLPDGSVRFFDSDGNESGGIAAPWALDANGEEVPTRYALDGTTLIQTVNHEGAAYPVVADPAWLLAVYVAVKLYAPTAAVVLSACGAAQCAAIARTTGTAVYNHVRPRGGSGGGRPGNTPTCNARNRGGC